MNSLLQGLSACPAFVKWLEEFTTQYSRDQQGPHTHQCLSLTLLNLLKGTGGWRGGGHRQRLVDRGGKP